MIPPRVLLLHFPDEVRLQQPWVEQQHRPPQRAGGAVRRWRRRVDHRARKLAWLSALLGISAASEVKHQWAEFEASSLQCGLQRLLRSTLFLTLEQRLHLLLLL